MTFDGMIESCTKFINVNPVYATEKIGSIDLLIVDEYQDFNEIERGFINIISKSAKTVIVLGDDDQCIYGFKDADSEGIIGLYNLSTTEKMIHENICYRCPDDIVERCNNLIKYNRNRIEKTLRISGKPGTIVFEQKRDMEATSQYVIEEINKIRSQENESTIMVLSPVSFAVADLLAKLDRENILHVNWFPPKTSLEQLKAFWVLRAVFGSKKVFNIMMLAYDQRNNSKRFLKFLSILKTIIQSNINAPTSIKQLIEVNLLEKQISESIVNEPTIEDFSGVFQNGVYSQLIPLIADPIIRERNLERLETLTNSPMQFEHNKVNVMSIHKSKGLQADYVFILGLVEGILPNEVTGIESVEAQRRVLFVGMSRAKKQLYLLSTMLWDGQYIHKVDKSKFKYDYKVKKYCGQTSCFVNELK